MERPIRSDPGDITSASLYLRQLAGSVARAYVEHTHPRAAILTGSAAEGVSDRYSDLDLILYYDTLPDHEAVQAARRHVGAVNVTPLGPVQERGFAEQFDVAGVTCQVACLAIEAWEAELAEVLAGRDVASPTQKGMGGVLDAIPLHGAELIRRWQDRLAAYPDALARATVAHSLRFFRVWYLVERWPARDATIWLHQLLAESALNLLGVLAGLNRVYYSPFEFKRTRAFAARLRLAPPDLYRRLEGLFAAPAEPAILELEALVRETLELVSEHMPEIDTSVIRRPPGARQQPWPLPSALSGGEDG